MAFKLVHWLWLSLSISAILADQTPPGSDDTCFTSNSSLPDENYKACCPDPAPNNKPQNGTGSVGGAQFTYECGYYPYPPGKLEIVGGSVGSMRDCAAHCARNSTCVAGAWSPESRGLCYLATKMERKEEPKLRRRFVLLMTALQKCKEDENACQSAKKACDSDRAECWRQQADTQTKLAECNRDKVNAVQAERQATMERVRMENAYTVNSISFTFIYGKIISGQYYRSDLSSNGIPYCLRECTKDTNCQGVNMLLNSVYKPACYFFSYYQYPPAGSYEYGLAAIPIRPR